MMQRGQHPVFGTDTQSVLEEIGFQLDEAHTQLYHELRDSGMPQARRSRSTSAISWTCGCDP
jgi:amidophosphoribosyltransferase